jgi:hypothetical protein
MSLRTRFAAWLLRGAAGYVVTASRSDASCCYAGLPAERVAPPASCTECNTLRAELAAALADVATVKAQRDFVEGQCAVLEAQRDHAATVAIESAHTGLFGLKQTTGQA